MNTSVKYLLILGLSLTTLVAVAPAQDPTFPPARTPEEAGEPPAVPNDDMAIQPRGPVHEAFAQPWSAAPQAGPVITKKPPAPIPEVPPEQRPEGDNVQWIPGYWAWDAAREDYLWVSGVWRIPPPGRKWVPGTWNTVEGGYQWSPGLWAVANQDELPFLDQPPPDSLDNGPSSPAPNDNSFYVPGNWMYQGSQYAWQPGFWQTYRPGMMWMPAYYSWSPGGYMYVPGYWDYPLANRGLMFAPVFFNRPLWNTPGWFYQPNYVVPFSSLLASLFFGPQGNGYYFGNYYGPSYNRLGYRPWFGGGWGNPLFNWYRWRYRGNPGWYSGLQAAYQGRYNGTLTRPPLTLIQQNTLINKTVNIQNNNSFNSLRMVQPLGQYNGVRLAQLSAAQLAQQRNRARNFQNFSAQRQNLQRAALSREARRVLPLTHGIAQAPPSAVRPANAIAPRTGPSPIITAQHTPGGPTVHAAPRGTGPHPIPPVHVNHGSAPHAPPVAAMHRAAPTPHHAAPAPVHHAAPAVHHAAPAVHHAAPAMHHAAPAVHHAAPAVHHAAAPVHHSAPASHGGGGHGGGGHGGHHR